MRIFRILWVEDDPQHFAKYSTQLQDRAAREGVRFDITPAQYGEKAFSLLFVAQTPFDLIILDLEMTEYNGIDTYKKVMQQLPGQPVLFLSKHLALDRWQRELSTLRRNGGPLETFDKNDESDAWCDRALELCSGRLPTILHVSDLHFGRFHALNESRGVRLEELIKSQLATIQRGRRINLVVVSGDVASIGATSEFERGIRFLDALTQELGLTADDVMIVPGNHDIYQRDEPGGRFDKYIRFLNEYYGFERSPKRKRRRSQALPCYSKLFSRGSQFLEWENGRHTPADITSFFVRDDLRCIIFGLNSVVDDEDEFAFGRIGAPQLLDAKTMIGNLSETRNRYLRVVVFHHNLFVVPSFLDDGDPERVVRNQGLVLRELMLMGVRVVFHGHTHYSVGYQHRQFYTDRPSAAPTAINVISTGTLAAQDRSAAQGAFQFTVVECHSGVGGGTDSCAVRRYRLPIDTLTWDELPRVNFDLGI